MAKIKKTTKKKPPKSTKKTKSSVPPPALAEFSGVRLGDARLDKRLKKIVEAMAANPSHSFPAAMGDDGATEGVYRLLNNGKVTFRRVLAPHVAHTVERAKVVERDGANVVVAVDKTTFKFNGDTLRSGLERMQKSDQGFETFAAIVVTLDRQPLGVVDVTPLEGRGRADAYKWAESLDAAAKAMHGTNPIYVADREADAYELLNHLSTTRFVVRASAGRNVRETEGAELEALNEVSRRSPVMVTRKSVTLSRRSKKGPPGSVERNPPREERVADLSIRACPVVVSKPRHLSGDFPKGLTLNVVHVLEENPPPDVEPVEWLLFTSLPIETVKDVELIVDAYRARWTVEEFFKVLKTGCAFEKRQLESKDALLNALGILVPIAWRLLALKEAANDESASATTFLDGDELHVLRKMSNGKLGARPSASEALHTIAAIGGHMRQNGRPGWLVLWRGFSKLLERVEGYRMARDDLEAADE